MSVIKIEEATELVKTKDFPYGNWPFEEFNKVQSAVYPHVSNDTNMVIAASTSVGKTIMGELFMADTIRRLKKKAMYIGPLKALAKEKQDDWQDKNHHFRDLNVSICSGDYRLTTARIKELNNSDVIVMTPEMLASRCRNQKSEKSTFLKDVGVIVFDESHLLTVPSRGDHIEIAIMKMAEINPNVRFVLLSATMPNVSELGEWISKLTNKDTVLIESDWRPAPLYLHFQPYYDGYRNYEDKEIEKISTAINIINHYPDDKFLVFVHTKNTGRLMIEALKESSIDAEFHSADLTAEKRHKLEKSFKDDPKYRVIVATSTLAWGCNLPARRVIIVGVHRGLTLVENYDLQQMAGRSGRPQYDPQGDCYILVPESEKNSLKIKIQKKTKIRSQLLEDVSGHHKTLAFHVVSEIHHRNITTKEGFHEWFSKSLAHFQDHDFDDSVIDKVIELLINNKCVHIEDYEYKTTAIGMIASMFYFSPFDVSDLKNNFSKLFEYDGNENNDYRIAMSLGNIDSHRFNIVNKAEKYDIEKFKDKIGIIYKNNKFTDSCIKAACGYYNMLNGINPPSLGALQSGLKLDLERTMEVVNAIDNMSTKWEKKDFFASIKQRLMYGVPLELLELVQIPNVGKARAERLYSAGIKDLNDLCTKDLSSLGIIMKLKDDKAVKKIQDDAKLVRLRKML